MILKELFAKLGFDVQTEGFVKAELLVGGIKKGLEVLGDALHAGAEGIADLILGTSELADMIDETSQKVGASSGALQELAYAAGFSGLDVEGLAGGLTFLVKNMNAAKDGSKETAAAFNSIGVSITDVDGKLRPAEDVLMDVADHFGTMEDGSEKTALALQLLGRSGASMIPFLNTGREGIESLRDEARDLGVVLDEETIKAGAALDDTMTRLQATAQGLKNSIGGPLLADANKLGEEMLKWVRANRELIKQRIDKVMSVLKVGAGILLDALKLLIEALGFVIDNWRLLAVIVAGVATAALLLNLTTVLALAKAYVAAGVASTVAAAKAGAAWLIANAPIIALASLLILIALLIEDAMTAADGGQSLMDAWLGDWMDDEPDDPWWLRAVKSLAFLMLNFGDVIDFWLNEFAKMWDDLVKWFDDGVDSLVKIINDTIDSWRKAFDDFWKWIVDSIDDIADKIGDFFVDMLKDTPLGKILKLAGVELDDSETDSTSAFGSGSLPVESSTSTSTSATSSAFAAQFNITAAPGQSPVDVGSAAVSSFDTWYQSTLDDARASVE